MERNANPMITCEVEILYLVAMLSTLSASKYGSLATGKTRRRASGNVASGRRTRRPCDACWARRTATFCLVSAYPCRTTTCSAAGVQAMLVVSQQWAIILLGHAIQYCTVLVQVYCKCRSRISNTLGDRYVYEVLYKLTCSIIWVIFRRRDFELVEHEIGRCATALHALILSTFID